jgi:S-adenosyl-L-methionine hydrolase (adenosine-forming)
VLITLLTDFGTSDYFVAAMKGRILRVDSSISIVDISHEVPPHDIDAAAFLLDAVFRDFPDGTVHLVVVDPGVGSLRKPVVASAHRHFFVAPDNGVLSFVLASDAASEVHEIELTADDREVSTTFHGRDIFAPAAARLAVGLAPSAFGAQVPEPVLLPSMHARREADGATVGRIIHIDHFGNCITSLRRPDLPGEGSFRAEVGGVAISDLRQFYQSSSDPGPFLIVGSAGFLEISMLRSSAAAELGISQGDSISIRAT